MKLRELKEILNRTTEHDDLEVYVSPLVEIENPNDNGFASTTALVPELLERYRILKVMQFSPHIESAPDEAMIIGYDDSVNCAETVLNEAANGKFVN